MRPAAGESARQCSALIQLLTSGNGPTSDAQDRASKETSNACIVVILLLAQVGGCAAGELVDTTDGS